MDIAKQIFKNGRNHLDLYVNYSCNLRCTHCFVGEQLERRESFETESILRLLKYCRIAGAKSVSFLGGEPSLYKKLNNLVNVSYDLGYEQVKIITNGMKALERFIQGNRFIQKPVIVFSYDSSNLKHFEAIRGRGTFKQINRSIVIARDMDYCLGAIISVTKTNYNDIVSTIRELEDNGFSYVNVHHVNELGYATKEDIVLVEDWITLVNQLKSVFDDSSILIKLEEKFHKKEDYSNTKSNCVVNDDISGNVMVFPDGKIYRCALFINSLALNSLEWDGQKILEVKSKFNEKTICAGSCSQGCPKSNDVLGNSDRFMMSCMYDKYKL